MSPSLSISTCICICAPLYRQQCCYRDLYTREGIPSSCGAYFWGTHACSVPSFFSQYHCFLHQGRNLSHNSISVFPVLGHSLLFLRLCLYPYDRSTASVLSVLELKHLRLSVSQRSWVEAHKLGDYHCCSTILLCISTCCFIRTLEFVSSVNATTTYGVSAWFALHGQESAVCTDAWLVKGMMYVF